MNAKELAQALASRAADVAAYLLPGGKKAGAEFKAGSVGGGGGTSLSVRLSGHKAGLWADFATGEGGDLLDLWAAARSLSIGQAITEAKQYLGIRDTMPAREVKQYRRPEKPKCKPPAGPVKEWLSSRGISDATIDAFKIGEQIRDGKTYAIFPYLRDGVLVNAKARNVAEKKDMRQESGAEPCLFGWHLIDPRCRFVAICEGEIDAMTLHQSGVPALSVNAGAGNHQWIDSDWDRLERFSDIVLCFDDDEAGKKGQAEVMKRLGFERCRVASFGAKDANQWLMDGACGEDISDAVRNAKHQDPDELRAASDYITKVTALFYPEHSAERDPQLILDKPLPWFEFRPGELTVWTGYNGHGKSLMLSQALLGLMQQGEQVVIFSGEMTPERQLKRMVKQAAGMDRPTPEYIGAIGRWLNRKLWLFAVVGSAKVSRLIEVFTYANRRYGARHFVIDSLMMTDVPEDGPGSMSQQKEAIQRMCDFAKRSGCHLHLVAHPRKGQDERGAPGKLDVAGSSKITDGADNVFSVWSARKDESEDPTDEPDAKLELQKQRNGEAQHFTQWLWFNRAAQQFTTSSRRASVCFVEFNQGRQHENHD